MLKPKRKKSYPLNIRRFGSPRKLMNELKEKNKVRPSRNVKAKVKELQNKMMRNIALKMRLREYFGWGRASFKRNLDRMTGRGYRIPRLGRN